MGGGQGLLDVLDTRSFSSIWYWLMLTLLWTWVGRGALGIPSELVSAVRPLARNRDAAMQGPAPGQQTPTVETARAPAPESLLLLDWLSLVLPRWRIAPRDGLVLLALAAFGLAALATFGFFYGRQTGQALFFLVGPLSVLLAMRLRLAARLDAVMTAAETGQTAPDPAAAEAARLITAHMRATMALSIIAVGAAVMWGTSWLARHPNWI